MKPSPETQLVHGPFVATRQPMSRRHFLRGTGVALALPWLEAMLPRFARGQQPAAPSAPDAKPRRMFAVIQNLGFIPTYFFPSGAGRDYALSPYLELLKDHRNDFTVFTGVSLPNVDGGHPTDVAWLTGAPHPGKASFRNTISLDQVVARELGHLTRFPSLTLAANTRTRSLSSTATGARIDPVENAAELYKLLFVQGPQAELDAQILKLETGRSILDAISGQAANLQGSLGTADRERMDQYYTSVRTLERNLQASQSWLEKPKPSVSAREPVAPASPARYFEKIRLMYEMATLAFQTDSTRAITLFIDSVATPIVEGTFEVPITEAYMRLAYHENVADRIWQFHALSAMHFRQLNALLGGLKAAKEGDESLLDRTQLLWGSNFNEVNANPNRPPLPTVVNIDPRTGATPRAQLPRVGVVATNPPNGIVRLAPMTVRRGAGVTTNLPIVFAGGGWKHGQHLVFDTERNYPLTNLHLSMLRRMGIPEKVFSSSTGEFQGLEMV